MQREAERVATQVSSHVIRGEVNVTKEETVSIATTDTITDHAVHRIRFTSDIARQLDLGEKAKRDGVLREVTEMDVFVVKDLCAREVDKEPEVFRAFSPLAEGKPDIVQILTMAARITENNMGEFDPSAKLGQSLSYFLGRPPDGEERPPVRCSLYNGGFVQVYDILVNTFNPELAEYYQLITPTSLVGLDMTYGVSPGLDVQASSVPNYIIAHAHPILVSMSRNVDKDALLVTPIEPFWNRPNNKTMVPAQVDQLVTSYRWTDAFLELRERFQLEQDVSKRYDVPIRIDKIDTMSLPESNRTLAANLENALIFHASIDRLMRIDYRFNVGYSTEASSRFSAVINHYMNMRDALIIQYAERVQKEQSSITSYDLLALYTVERMVANYGYPPKDRRVYESLNKALDTIIASGQVRQEGKGYSVLVKRLSRESTNKLYRWAVASMDY